MLQTNLLQRRAIQIKRTQRNPTLDKLTTKENYLNEQFNRIMLLPINEQQRPAIPDKLTTKESYSYQTKNKNKKGYSYQYKHYGASTRD